MASMAIRSLSRRGNVDVVLAARRPGDDGHWVQRIVHNSDNWLARVVPRGGRDLEPVVEQFRSLGCEAQATRYGLVTITLPVEVDVSTIMDLLGDGQERAGSWYFDLGVASPA